MKGKGSGGFFPPSGVAPATTAIIVPPLDSGLPSPTSSLAQHETLWSVYTGDYPHELLGYAASLEEAQAIAAAHAQPS